MKSLKQVRFTLISGSETEDALMGTVAMEVSPLADGPVKTRSVILKGNDTASHGPGRSPTRVVSDPVGIVAFGLDDPQEVRNAMARRAISDIVPVHFTIPSRLPPPLMRPMRRLEHFAQRLDNEVESKSELARRARAILQRTDHCSRAALCRLTVDPTNRLLPDLSTFNSSLR